MTVNPDKLARPAHVPYVHLHSLYRSGDTSRHLVSLAGPGMYYRSDVIAAKNHHLLDIVILASTSQLQAILPAA